MITWKKFKELITRKKKKKLLEHLRGRNMAAIGVVIEEVIRWI